MNVADVLNLVCDKIEALNPLEDHFLRSNGNDNGFEELFPLIMEQVAEECFPEAILSMGIHLGHHFPDIDLFVNNIKYGIELKSRNNGSWSTNGNSVFESITSEDYEDIFVVFASKVPREKRYLVRYAPYWQATTNIKVTHSPRFTINMLDNVESVFQSKEEYDNLKNLDENGKSEFIQNYFRENSIGATWYTKSDENIPPTLYSDLDSSQKNKLKVEILILYIHDLLLGSKNTKYLRAGEYMLETYFVYSRALRDPFSSGGKYPYNGAMFPKMIGTLVTLKELLIHTLQNSSDDFIELAKQEWSKTLPNYLIIDDLYESYKNILDYIGTNNTVNTEQSPQFKTYAMLLEEASISNLSDIIL